MSVYYNEIDPFAAAWLRELMKAGQIPDGEVDTRSIVDVRADDLRGFRQCHFFAGIGGWAYALKLAGWPDDRAVWTGSCPCQPWSVAGSADGPDDPRDLWPAWFRLIDVCGPLVVFGEQVESPAGRAWLDRVCAWMEGVGYAVGAIDLPAVCVGAPHLRRRIWFVADAEGNGRRQGNTDEAWSLERTRQERARKRLTDNCWSDSVHELFRDGRQRPLEPGLEPLAHGVPGRVGRLRGYGNAIVPQVAQVFIESYLDLESPDV